MRNLKSGFILSYISIFIQSIISILYTPVMLRLLGESNYGLLQLAISTMSSLSILSFGFGSSYMRFYSQYKADNDNNAISVLNGMFTIIFISVSILSLIVGGFITVIAVIQTATETVPCPIISRGKVSIGFKSDDIIIRIF